VIIEGIEKYLNKCSQDPMKIARKDYDIISDILADCKLSELENYPMCYRQIEAHFKIMATRWRFDNIDNKTNRMFEPAIINGKNNFVDLGKAGVLSDYLLKHSNRN